MSFSLFAPNGMNLSRSVHNPKSRFRRMVDYLSVKGEATREDILRDVFGKTIGVYRGVTTPNVVTRGWGCYMFSLSIKYGYIKMVRRGNRVFYSVV
jgi:hypothetical protein